MFYIYILRSKKDDSFYIGQTNDLNKRLDFHNRGLSRYTSRKLPWILVYSEAYKTRKEALQRERFLKKQRNRDFYESLINKRSGSSAGYPESSGLPEELEDKSKDID